MSSDLGEILKSALTRGQNTHGGPILFIGMDAPHVDLVDINRAFDVASRGEAYICPGE